MQGSHSTKDLRTRAIEALRRGVPVGEVAFAFGFDRTTVFRWTKRFATNGDAGLDRKAGSGRPRKLQQVSLEAIKKIILAPATKFGFESDLWTVGRLHRVLTSRFKIRLSQDTIWRRLRDAGMTYQKPVREYHEVNYSLRDEWLKTTVPKIKETIKKHRAVLYFQDESNISLTAFLGKTWAPRGQTPKVRVTGKRGGVSAMSAINGGGKLVFKLLEKRINTKEVIVFLKQMLAFHPKRHLVVVMDQAKPHTSNQMKKFLDDQRRLHVFYLPPYSPDWNPDEKVWNHLKTQELKSHTARSQSELKSLTNKKLRSMANKPSLLRGIYFRCHVASFFR